MSEEETTPETIARREYFRYLAALYRLGLHDTVRMMKDGDEVYNMCKRPPLLKYW